ncbi:MAG: hypothetical protein HYZ08_02755 [Candidatus Kerfeldbacteria bacterium]|nr:hypothetical protein [Candidatus Kerfeldbacteria bacterium]
MISGNEHLSNERIATVVKNYLERRIFGILPQQHALFLLSGPLKNELDSQFYLKQIDVKKTLPHRIEITIEERLPGLMFRHAAGEWILDDEGVVLGTKDQLPPGVYPPVEYEQTPAELEVTNRHVVLRPELATFILDLFEELPDQLPLHPQKALILPTECVPDVDLPNNTNRSRGEAASTNATNTSSSTNSTITGNENSNVNRPPIEPEFTLEDLKAETSRKELEQCQEVQLAQDVRIQLQEGYDVLFTIQEPLASQFDYLRSFLDSDIVKGKSVSVIDLRFGNKIFYQ